MNPYYGHQSWGYAPTPAPYPYAQTPSQSYADVAPGTAAYGAYGYGYPPPAAAAYSLPPGYTAAASQERESAPTTTVSTAEYVRWYNENFGSQPAPSAYGYTSGASGYPGATPEYPGVSGYYTPSGGYPPGPVAPPAPPPPLVTVGSIERPPASQQSSYTYPPPATIAPSSYSQVASSSGSRFMQQSSASDAYTAPSSAALHASTSSASQHGSAPTYASSISPVPQPQHGGMNPALLRFVARGLDSTKSASYLEKKLMNDALETIVKQARDSGSLFSKDWDSEPLPQLLGATTAPSSGSIASKAKRSRWGEDDEPVAAPTTQREASTYGSRMSASQQASYAALTRPPQTPAPRPVTYAAAAAVNTSAQPQQSYGSLVASTSTSSATALQSYGSALSGQSSYGSAVSGQSSYGSALSGQLFGRMHVGSSYSARARSPDRSSSSSSSDEESFISLSAPASKRANKRGGVAARKKQDEYQRSQAQRKRPPVDDTPCAPLNEADYEKMKITGFCQTLEKKYLRLTAPPDPAVVRPEPILILALAALKQKWKDSACSYRYICDQLKAIRQDLTGDSNEFNQCQTQLITLHEIPGMCDLNKRCEFLAYRLIYYTFNGSGSGYLTGQSIAWNLNCSMRGRADSEHLLASLQPELYMHEAVLHALQVRSAVAVCNYTKYFKLYASAPNMSAYAMEFINSDLRIKWLTTMAKACKGSLPLVYVMENLAFPDVDTCKQFVVNAGGDIDEEKAAWLTGTSKIEAFEPPKIYDEDHDDSDDGRPMFRPGTFAETM